MVRKSLKSEMSTLSIELWGQEEQPYEAEFQGTWLVDPEPNETRAGPEDGTQWDLGAFYGVALTARGNILVYVAHCNDGWAPFYETYPSIEAARGDVPDSILAAAASSLGEDFTVTLDV
jgi:hypothetical protein